MRGWLAVLDQPALENVRQDIEHFCSNVTPARERRSYFDIFLWLDEEGKELDELLTVTHQTIRELQRRQPDAMATRT